MKIINNPNFQIVFIKEKFQIETKYFNTLQKLAIKAETKKK